MSLNRRSLFGALASLPFMGFLLGQKVEAKGGFIPAPLQPSSYIEETRFPTLHIPNEDGSTTCIPLNCTELAINYNGRILEINTVDNRSINYLSKIGKTSYETPSEIPPFLKTGPEYV